MRCSSTTERVAHPAVCQPGVGDVEADTAPGRAAPLRTHADLVGVVQETQVVGA